MKTPVLIIPGDADGYRLEHIVSLFRLQAAAGHCPILSSRVGPSLCAADRFP